MVQEVAEVLQSDIDEAKKILKEYSYGDDEIMDDLLDDAGAKLLQVLRKELIQEPRYVRYAPSIAVFTGGGAGMHIKNSAPKVLGVRRARISTQEHLIADGEDMLFPSYTSALSLALYSQQHGGSRLATLKEKAGGLLDRMLAKLGLN